MHLYPVIVNQGRESMKTMRLLVFAMMILIATIVPATAQDQSEPTVVGGDEASLREFIARMFGNTDIL